MAITAKVYGLAIKSLANKEIDWDTDTIKAVLCTSSYTPNQDTHQYASSLTGELSGGSYTRQTLASKTTTYDTSTNTHKLDCADITWTAITAADFQYMVYVDTQTGSDSTSPLIAYVNFGSVQTATAQDVTVGIDAAGAVAFTVA
jgi:hypothetical protein